MNSKKNNARIQKWRKMISEGIFKDPELLQSRIRKGIPPAMRQLAWPEIIKLQKFIEEHKHKHNYSKLTNSISNNIYEITLDIPRTFPEEEDSKVLRKSMNNVLKAISIVYPRVGYCQGMNFLTLRLLQILNDNETFWLLYYLLENDASLMKNFIDPKKIEQQSFVLVELMKQYCPSINQLFEKQNISIQVFTVKCFMTIFSSVFNQQLFYRIFEVFLYEGWAIIYAVGLVLLITNQHKILKNSYQSNLYLINSEIYHIDKIDPFLQQVFNLQISSTTLKTLNDRFIKNSRQKDANREATTNRNSQIRLRQSENKKSQLPKPQNQIKQQLKFQAKSQEVTFNSFQLLSHRADQQQAKKSIQNNCY